MLSEEDKDLLKFKIRLNPTVNKFMIGSEFVHRIVGERMGLEGGIEFFNNDTKDCRRTNLIEYCKTKVNISVSKEDEDLLTLRLRFEKALNRVVFGGRTKFVHRIIGQRMGMKGNIIFKDNNPLNCKRDNLIEMKERLKPLVSKEDKDLLSLHFRYDNKKQNIEIYENHRRISKVIAERMGLKGQIGFKDKNHLNCRRDNLYETRRQINPIVSKQDEDLLKQSFHFNTTLKKFQKAGTNEYLHRIIAQRMGLTGLIKFKDGNTLNCKRSNLIQLVSQKKTKTFSK